MKNTPIFKRLLGYLKAHRLYLFFVLLSTIISTAFMVLAPFLVGKVTTTLLLVSQMVYFIGKPLLRFCWLWLPYI